MKKIFETLYQYLSLVSLCLYLSNYFPSHVQLCIRQAAEHFLKEATGGCYALRYHVLHYTVLRDALELCLTHCYIRFYTSGYDFFAPPQAVVYHLWTRDHRPSFLKDAQTVEGECVGVRVSVCMGVCVSVCV